MEAAFDRRKKNENENETPPVVQYVFLYRKSALRSARALLPPPRRLQSPLFTEGEKRVKRVGVRGGDRADAAAAAERRVAPARARGGASFCPPGTTRRDRECFRASAPPGGAGAVARARRSRASKHAHAASAMLLHRRTEALVRATRVRALAADAASASAETHLASTLAAHAEFTMRMRERTRRQADLLASFEDDLENTPLDDARFRTTDAAYYYGGSTRHRRADVLFVAGLGGRDVSSRVAQQFS